MKARRRSSSSRRRPGSRSTTTRTSIDNPEYFAKVQGRSAPGQGHRPRHHRLDRQRPLLGEYVSQGLGAEARQEPHPEHLEPHRRAGEPAVRPEPRVLAPLVLGHGRDRLERGTSPSPSRPSRSSSRPEAQGQGAASGTRWATRSGSSCSRTATTRRRSPTSRSTARSPRSRRPSGLGPDPQVLRQRLRAAARDRRPRGVHRVVRRHRSAARRQPEAEVGHPGEGRDHLDGQHAHPARRQRADGVDVHELRLRPEDRRAARPRRRLHLVGQGREGGGGEARPGGG